MIINTGSRTDIPGYYSEWFFNRIKEGFVYARNPYYPEQVTKYTLSPEVVDCICFCTKNPIPALPHLSEIRNYGQYWFVTITPYGKDIEPHVPDKEKVMEAFRQISQEMGKEKTGWRYDPVFINEKYTLDFHVKAFEEMAEKLAGYTDSCVISFIDLYEKTKKNFRGIHEVRQSDREAIVKEFVRIGKKNKMTIRTCHEEGGYEKLGADTSGCMTKEIIERAIGQNLLVPPSKRNGREGCNCLLGNDIGGYNTCGHGCLYCYANYDRKTVEQNMRLHNPQSPLLTGELSEEDVIKEVKQVSFCSGQMTLPL